MIPYGRHGMDERDIQAVVETLRSGWLTCGPRVADFERAFADAVTANGAAAVSSGTAALHAIMHALGVGPGDEVIVPAMTFAATANCVVYQGATPVFADVEPGALLIDPRSVARRITARTKAVIAVDYAGQPCDYAALGALTRSRGLALVADACHSLGASRDGVMAGAMADLSAFSFHPVKHITTGEGGMVTAADPQLLERVRRFRNHGMTTSFADRESAASYTYEIHEPGFNYRISDIACALGLSQLARLGAFVDRRREIAARYDRELAGMDRIKPLSVAQGVAHAYHLYVVKLGDGFGRADRDRVFATLRQSGVGVNVHYIPVHLQPFYRRAFGLGEGLCPAAEQAFERILSLPIFPDLTQNQQERVIAALASALAAL
ncbi:MAG: UDP-4-amino-4,6-dideoxy-N-acetyl-beta-L-altrosamine transaminase [Desulfovibrionaceae bacterium]|nr:UDP-4-amino-4,6-dideoxy-N-acetyl-beta-L-altrosamine transaminase [Desulfovibrionaceae bacterium]MBF0512662.1 UDP-4-amino-4,6-dideoxy-N-acetyl-beta-L-altrosamine transaminase [Desulfovibrionaceae bacterium]